MVDYNFGSLWGGRCSIEPLGTHGMDLWKNIRRVWGNFSSHIRFEVGNGSKVCFWHDPWYGDMALKVAFSDLFGIVCAKDAFVASHLELFGGAT
jgi:hypothetical protein